MSVVSRTTGQDGKVEISINGRFDFAMQKDFREAYRNCPIGTRFRVDLSRTEYLDSAALGMLLLLRQHGGDDNDSVLLAGPPDSIMNILRVANFDRIFRIE